MTCLRTTNKEQYHIKYLSTCLFFFLSFYGLLLCLWSVWFAKSESLQRPSQGLVKFGNKSDKIAFKVRESLNDHVSNGLLLVLYPAAIPKRSPLQILYFSLLLSLHVSSCESLMKNAVFKKKGEGRRLVDNIFLERKVASLLDCSHLCLAEREKCRAVNYERQETCKNPTTYRCQLCSETADSKPGSLLSEEAFDYFEQLEPLWIEKKNEYQDIDECNNNPCHQYATCNNTFESYNCTCIKGFSGTGNDCADVDECKSYPCNQYATCNNTFGSYNCTCIKGFSRTGNNCTDIDECKNKPCHQYATCNNAFGSYNCKCIEGFFGDGNNCTARNCKELQNQNKANDGIYYIDPDGHGSFEVRCDMTTDLGGWTVFQRRLNGSVDFYRNWTDYKNGFGDMNGEFWLGLDKIYRITHSEQQSLRVDMGDFESNFRHASYSQFSVESETAQYRITVSGYSGNAGDSLKYHSGMKFSTKNRDNDAYSSGNCAIIDKGAWWFKNCNECNLNGIYYSQPNVQYNKGIQWQHWKGNNYSLKKSEMKVRSN